MERALKLYAPFAARFPEIFGTDRIQFVCPPDTPVLAMADGMILRASYEDPKQPNAGLGLRIRHIVSHMGFDSWTLVYGHLSVLETHIGQKVRAGQRIGLSSDKLTIQLLDLTGKPRQIPYECYE